MQSLEAPSGACAERRVRDPSDGSVQQNPPAGAAFNAEADVLTSAAQGRLKSFIERIERLEEDKAAVTADLKEVYAEAKGEGFDTKILRKVVRLLKRDKAKRQEEEALIDLYLSAFGGL